MTVLHLFPTHPPARAPLAEFLDRAVNSSPEEQRLRIAFAYATSAGVERLITDLGNVGDIAAVEMEWLLGLHHGLTEPRAIEMAQLLPQSTVRVVHGGSTLTQQSLIKGERVHAKTIGVGPSRSEGLSSLLVGSANLTRAALGHPSNNFELGLEAHGVDADLGVAFSSWWSGAWSSGVAVTPQLLDTYARLRGTYLRTNPEELHRLDDPGQRLPSLATDLWIEMGAASGGARNQVEFGTALAGFFGPPASSTALQVVEFDGTVWTDRPLSPKRTSFGVDIWRLSLPPHATIYAGRVIRLSRRKKGGFTLRVADVDSRAHSAWRNRASRSGHLGRTGAGSGREYGFY